MKRKPLLPGLMAACLLFSGANAAGHGPGNPIRAGQLWVMLSTSKLDPSISTIMTFRTVGATRGGRHVLGEDATGLGGQSIVIDYDPATEVIVVTDRTPTVYKSKNIRLCAFDVKEPGEVYQGRAAHFAASKKPAEFGAFFKGWAASHPKASVQDGVAAYTQALAPTDNAPCKLELAVLP
ncbi:hypothetical protein [Deinococcus sp.]|uniref:hypothetical protein n=1 Tax=Deinococcus sp. TaxID=47478 RepID=UPI003C7E9471